MVGSYDVFLRAGIEIRDYSERHERIVWDVNNWLDSNASFYYEHFFKLVIFRFKGYFQYFFYRRLMFANGLLYFKCKHNKESE